MMPRISCSVYVFDKLQINLTDVGESNLQTAYNGWRHRICRIIKEVWFPRLTPRVLHDAGTCLSYVKTSYIDTKEINNNILNVSI